MARTEAPVSEIVPDDEGEAARRSGVRALLAGVMQASPRTLLGAPLIQELASELNMRRQKSMPDVTVVRLALRLRHTIGYSANLLAGSVQPRSSGTEPRETLSGGITRTLPDAKLAKKAKRKLRQANAAFDKMEAILTSPEVAAFATLDIDALVPMREEMERLDALAIPPYGLERGHPIVGIAVLRLHKVLYCLTGSWLRDWSDKEIPDRFISDALFKMIRKLAPAELSDGAIAQTVETAIKQRKNKPKSA